MRHTRELVISGTPYRLIYRITPEQIEDLRVMHGSRYWPRRG